MYWVKKCAFGGGSISFSPPPPFLTHPLHPLPLLGNNGHPTVCACDATIRELCTKFSSGISVLVPNFPAVFQNWYPIFSAPKFAIPNFARTKSPPPSGIAVAVAAAFMRREHTEAVIWVAAAVVPQTCRPQSLSPPFLGMLTVATMGSMCSKLTAFLNLKTAGPLDQEMDAPSRPEGLMFDETFMKPLFVREQSLEVHGRYKWPRHRCMGKAARGGHGKSCEGGTGGLAGWMDGWVTRLGLFLGRGGLGSPRMVGGGGLVHRT